MAGETNLQIEQLAGEIAAFVKDPEVTTQKRGLAHLISRLLSRSEADPRHEAIAMLIEGSDLIDSVSLHAVSRRPLDEAITHLDLNGHFMEIIGHWHEDAVKRVSGLPKQRGTIRTATGIVMPRMLLTGDGRVYWSAAELDNHFRNPEIKELLLDRLVERYGPTNPATSIETMEKLVLANPTAVTYSPTPSIAA